MNAELQKSMQVTGMVGGFDTYLLIILGIMLIAGVLGGLANFYLSDRRGELTAGDAFKYVILGVVAALTVPLFLNMISSNLLEAARTHEADFFVFAGFCLIYVVASRRAFENVVQRLLAQVDQVRRDVNQLKTQKREIQIVREEAPAPVDTAKAAELPKDALSYNDVEILRAIAEESYVYGNLIGLTDKTGLGRDLVSTRLTVLKNQGVIETRINDKNVLHWYVSPKGRQLLGDILCAGERKSA